MLVISDITHKNYAETSRPLGICPTITYRVKGHLEKCNKSFSEKKQEKSGEDRSFPVTASNIFLAIAFIYSG